MTIGEKEVCRYKMFQTEHPQYMIIKVGSGVFLFQKTEVPTNDLDIFMYINAKIVHITRGIERSIKYIYKSLSTRICELERTQLKTLTSLAFISPVSFAYQYMNAPG